MLAENEKRRRGASFGSLPASFNSIFFPTLTQAAIRNKIVQDYRHTLRSTWKHYPTQVSKGLMMSSYMDMGQNPLYPDENTQEELEHLLLHGTRSPEPATGGTSDAVTSKHPRFSFTQASSGALEDEDDSEEEISMDSDVQGAFGLYAEAAQDMATASLELSLGRHFACVDYCNQAVEKAAQAVSLFRQGHRAMYDHDLRALGAAVGAPAEVQEDMATLTPFHPEAFYAETPPEEADEVISAEQASEYIGIARRVLRWARGIIL
jgi:HEPN domain-containing protein